MKTFSNHYLDILLESQTAPMLKTLNNIDTSIITTVLLNNANCFQQKIALASTNDPVELSTWLQKKVLEIENILQDDIPTTTLQNTNEIKQCLIQFLKFLRSQHHPEGLFLNKCPAKRVSK